MALDQQTYDRVMAIAITPPVFGITLRGTTVKYSEQIALAWAQANAHNFPHGRDASGFVLAVRRIEASVTPPSLMQRLRAWVERPSSHERSHST